MGIGEWIGSSLGFTVVMLGAMGTGVGLVVYAALAAMRGSVAGEAWEASPAPVPGHQVGAPPAAEPVAVRLAG